MESAFHKGMYISVLIRKISPSVRVNKHNVEKKIMIKLKHSIPLASSSRWQAKAAACAGPV